MWYLEFIISWTWLKGSLVPLSKTKMTLYMLLMVVLTSCAAISLCRLISNLFSYYSPQGLSGIFLHSHFLSAVWVFIFPWWTFLCSLWNFTTIIYRRDIQGNKCWKGKEGPKIIMFLSLYQRRHISVKVLKYFNKIFCLNWYW